MNLHERCTRIGLEWLFALAMTIATFAPAISTAERPNFVIVMTDDQGYRDRQQHDPRIQTPTLTRLAVEGFELTNFHATTACSPSRAALLTGRHGIRTGALGLMTGERALDERETTIAQRLRAAGYRTGLVGKWHLSEKPSSVSRAGFDFFYGFLGGATSYVAPSNLLRRDKPLGRVEGYSSDLFADEAVAFIQRNQGRPFFLLLSLNAPHEILQGHPDDLARYPADRFSPYQRHYFATLTSADRALSRVRATIESLGLADRTILIFLSDNGPASVQKAKATLYRAGAHVPFVAWGPGRIQPGRSDELTSIMDVFPTLLEWAGEEPPRGVALDGTSLLSIFAREPHAPLHDALIQQWVSSYAIFDSKHRLVLHHKPFTGMYAELFDVVRDPDERRNLLRTDYATAAPIFRRLMSRLERGHRDMTGDPSWSLKPFRE